MTERFPTKEEWQALRKLAEQRLAVTGSMVTVQVYKDTVNIVVDGCNVFQAKAWMEIQNQISIHMPKEPTP